MVDQVQIDGILWAVAIALQISILIVCLLIYAELQGRKTTLPRNTHFGIQLSILMKKAKAWV